MAIWCAGRKVRSAAGSAPASEASVLDMKLHAPVSLSPFVAGVRFEGGRLAEPGALEAALAHAARDQRRHDRSGAPLAQLEVAARYVSVRTASTPLHAPDAALAIVKTSFVAPSFAHKQTPTTSPTDSRAFAALA